MTKLKELRISKGFTQKELSERADINIRTLQAYESGVREIESAKLETLVKLAYVLVCSITDLIDDEELVELCNGINL